MLNGHADEYSKPVLGSITGCSPITPIPLQKKARDTKFIPENEQEMGRKKYIHNIVTIRPKITQQVKKNNSPDIFSFSVGISNNPVPSKKLNRTI